MCDPITARQIFKLAHKHFLKQVGQKIFLALSAKIFSLSK
jgi:hypothetical protein